MIISRTFLDTIIQFLLTSHWYTSIKVSVYLLCVKKVKVLVAQSSPSLCDPMDYSQSGASDHGIPQARILEWITMPSSRESSQSRDQTHISHTAGGFFTSGATVQSKSEIRKS